MVNHRVPHQAIKQGSFEKQGKHDIVCANIVADVVIRLFQNVADFMNDDGILIVSGIIDMRAAEVEKSALEHGFKIAESLMREEWHAYVLTK